MHSFPFNVQSARLAEMNFEQTRTRRTSRHNRDAAQRGAGTFPARDPRPGEVRGRRHSHAGIHERRDLVEIRYRSEASPRCLRPSGIRTFIRFVRARVPSRIHPGHLLPRHENLEEVAPFRPVPDRVHTRCGCFRNFRWIGTFVKASPPSREARDGGERAWS